ncbi:MAG: asparagine synthase (glutamine-hydrolyzing) [Roseburia sp.]|nr:asparagine synthase (glutamine-hydrolyzing) [Roseburia sp.]
MCGIFGCIGKLHKDRAFECITRIKHRGPDALVVKELDGIVLAHARLAILDTSDIANQPMSDLSGRYWIVYNGEVYNYHELKRELEMLGYTFRTNCDTEVVLYSYIEWGEEFQWKCNGMWSLAIWDDVEKKLFFSRDRFGVKPLYYYKQDGNFYFASEMKAFFPIMKERKINYALMDKKDYLGFENTEDCVIDGIKKILAGYCGYYQKGQLERHRWWNTLDNIVEVPAKYEEQVECLQELLIDSCKIRMRSDVPIGTALSGGLDSSTVVGMMKYVSNQSDIYVNKDWQHTFVASMPGTSIDETNYAKKASAYVGVDISEVPITDKVTPKQLQQYLYICEEPYTTAPIPFFQTYDYITRSGIRVTIDGHGADELFGGYRPVHYAAAKENRCDAESLVKIWEIYSSTFALSDQISFEKFVDIVDSRRFESGLDDKHRAWDKLDEANRRLYIETHERILPTLLRCYDRYSMGNGLEIRMPFMDYRIVCFAFSIPWTAKLRNGYTKSIVRDAAAPFMDKDIIYRKSKVGFNAPMTEWFHGELREFLLDTVNSKDFRECELIIDSDSIIQQVVEFYKDNRNNFYDGSNIWQAIVPYLWKEAVIKNWGNYS